MSSDPAGEADPATGLATMPATPPEAWADMRRLLHVIADAAEALLVHFEPAPPARPTRTIGTPRLPLERLLCRIAAQWPAVLYDATAPAEWLSEVLTTAAAAGLVAVPSSEVPPRTLRGCPLPARGTS